MITDDNSCTLDGNILCDFDDRFLMYLELDTGSCKAGWKQYRYVKELFCFTLFVYLTSFSYLEAVHDPFSDIQPDVC